MTGTSINVDQFLRGSDIGKGHQNCTPDGDFPVRCSVHDCHCLGLLRLFISSSVVPIRVTLQRRSVTTCVLIIMTISNDMAALVGFVCEAFFHGSFIARRDKSIAHSPLACYTMLFATAVYLKLNGPEDQRSVGRPLFIITVLLYLACSAHFTVQFAHFYIALVCVVPYSSYAGFNSSEHYFRTTQVSRDFQT